MGSRGAVLPRHGEGGSEYGYPLQAGGWGDGSVHVFQGECGEGEGGKVRRVQQGKFL